MGHPERSLEAAEAAPRAHESFAATALDERRLPAASSTALEVEEAAGPAEAPDRRAAAWLFRDDTPARQFGLAELPALIADDANMAWVDLCDYPEGELRTLADGLGLGPAFVEAAVADWQRPRIAIFDDYYLVTAAVAHLNNGSHRVLAGQLDLVVGRNILLSIHKRPLPFAEAALGRARHSPELVRLDSAFMLYILLDELLAYYERLGEQIEDEIETMEQRALTDGSDAFLGDLLQLKRYVFALSRTVSQHRPVFAAFRRPDFRFVSGEQVEPYFRDLEERLDRLIDLLLPAREVVNGAFDIYVSQVAHRTNGVMKVLTIVSTVLLPASLIVGIFGTSFEGIPLYQPLGFVAMLAAIVVVTAAALLFFKHRKWI